LRQCRATVQQTEAVDVANKSQRLSGQQIDRNAAATQMQTTTTTTRVNGNAQETNKFKSQK